MIMDSSDNRRIHLAIIVGIVLVILILAGLCVTRIGLFRSPQAVLSEFLRDNGPESLQADRLILSGKKTEGLALETIKEKDAPKRRYLIGYLGMIRSTKSIPRLEAIVR